MRWNTFFHYNWWTLYGMWKNKIFKKFHSKKCILVAYLHLNIYSLLFHPDLMINIFILCFFKLKWMKKNVREKYFLKIISNLKNKEDLIISTLFLSPFRFLLFFQIINFWVLLSRQFRKQEWRNYWTTMTEPKEDSTRV